jgi:phenylpropionate dioxygenase-like ring-hydroxylating dioxygenase large terminal subunit
MANELLDEASVVARILDHIDRKTTDLSDTMWREPIANYLSPDRFRREVELAFRRTPTPFCPSAALPETGSYLAREVAGTPLLAVRGSDGIVRVFRNACRHRGMQVAEGSGCARAFACRYHGWSYGMDGSLLGVPHANGFPGLDRAANGLVPVAARERHGVVFVNQDAAIAEADINLPLDLFGTELEVFAYFEQDVAANWKIVAEGFLEGYHIQSTHRTTFYPIQYDNLNVVESFGRNNRITFPYRRIEKMRAVPQSERRSEGMLTYVYHLFPNVMVATFPTNTTMTVLEPLAVDRTRLLTWTLSDKANRRDDGAAAVAQGRDFVQVGAAEDREMSAAIQRGLASGANEFFQYGLFEGAIGRFHRALHEVLDGAS